MIPVQVDQVQQGIDRLLSVLKEKDNIEKLIDIFLTEVQEIEDANLELADQKNIDTAQGVWLDYIGSIIGEPRLGKSDPDYRSALRLKIQINSADGTPDLITNSVRQFTSGTDVRLRDLTIAASVLYTNGDQNLGSELWELIDNIKAAGVRIIIHNDRNDEAVLPSWEVDLPVVEILQVTDPTQPIPSDDVLVSLELFDGVNTEDMYVVTGLGATYYRTDTSRSIPYWENTSPLQGVTGGTTVPITGVTGGDTVPIEVFTSESDSAITLCWETEQDSTYTNPV